MSNIYSYTHRGAKDNAWALHVVRNAWGWSEDDQRRARHMVADAYEAREVTIAKLQTALLAAGAVISVEHATESVTIVLKQYRLNDVIKGLG